VSHYLDHATFPALATSNPCADFPATRGCCHPRPHRLGRARFAHPVKWFEDEVRPRMRGRATLVRFADDLVMTFQTYDAKRVMDVLGEAARTVRPHAARGEITGAG
jgi:hypothetical protein